MFRVCLEFGARIWVEGIGFQVQGFYGKGLVKGETLGSFSFCCGGGWR